jgi:NTE family protein
MIGSYRQLVNNILEVVDPALQAKMRQRPIYSELMGDGSATHITRFIRQGQQGEPASRDYDFSDIAIAANQAQGYALARSTMAREGAGTEDAAGVDGKRTRRGSSMMPEAADMDLPLASARYRRSGRGDAGW